MKNVVEWNEMKWNGKRKEREKGDEMKWRKKLKKKQIQNTHNLK